MDCTDDTEVLTQPHNYTIQTVGNVSTDGLVVRSDGTILHKKRKTSSSSGRSYISYITAIAIAYCIASLLVSYSVIT